MPYYRQCAGIIVFNKDKKVLVCARKGCRSEGWQFPQGGIMKKESAVAAAVRELNEETSITSVTNVKTLDFPLRYNFPGRIRRQMLRRGIDSLGQDMFWSLLYFFGSDSEININTEEPEFRAWEWVEPDEAVNRVISFKKKVYAEAVKMFKPLIENFSPSLVSNQ